jgi:hypothetical protein
MLGSGVVERQDAYRHEPIVRRKYGWQWRWSERTPRRPTTWALALELTDTVVMALGSPPGQRVTHHITMIRTESPCRCAARLSSRAAATP